MLFSTALSQRTTQGFNRQKAITLLILVVLACLGNHFRISLAFNIEFLFGGIASLLAIRFYGIGLGTAIAAISSVETVFAWNHPYAFIIFLLEALFIGWRLKKNINENLIYVDGVYWLSIGLPLVALFYGLILKVGLVPASIIYFKQSINGVLNACIASLIYDFALPALRAKRFRKKSKNSLANSLITIFVSFLLIPSLLLFVIDSHGSMQREESFVLKTLDGATKSLKQEINFLKDEQEGRSEKSNFRLSQLHRYPVEIRSRLNDETGNVVWNDSKISDTLGQVSQVEIKRFNSEQYLWLPRVPRQAKMVSWLNSYYVQTALIEGDPNLILSVESPTEPHIRYLQKLHLSSLIVLWSLLFIAISLASLASRKLVRPILELTAETTNLPAKILEDREIFLNPYPVKEVNDLLINFRQMATALNAQFKELQVANERIFREKQKAESANQAKSDFLARMSHEFKTPLNGIIGYSQVLKRSHNLSPDTQNKIETIHQCGNHLLGLVNDALDISVIETQKFELISDAFSLNQLLKQTVELFKTRVDELGIKLMTESRLYKPELTVLGDERRLRQVLINLISNAVEFTEEGQITLELEAVPCSPGLTTVLNFKVSDTGVGIRAKDLDRIFNAFEQSNRNSRRAAGTGLGLNISQNLVRMMGGEISVESELGRGSTFHFSILLPVADEGIQFSDRKKLGISPSVCGYQGERHTVLVVDDNVENRGVIHDLLVSLDFIVFEAESGGEGLSILQEKSFSLVIVDLLMPDMNGLEMIQEINRLPLAEKPRIIISSASVATREQQTILDAEGYAFLPKPVCAEMLLELLSEQLGLAWCYESVKSPSIPTFDEPLGETSPIINIPNSTFLRSLLSLSQSGKLRQLGMQLESLIQQDECYTQFAEQILSLQAKFDAEGIEMLLSKYLEEKADEGG